MNRKDSNEFLWEQEGDCDDIRPLDRPRRKKLFCLLAAVLVVAVLVVVLLSVPNGPEDVTFEYEALLKEVRLDADGHVVSLLTTPIGLDCDELIVYVQRGKKPVTPSGKTSYKKLEAGTLLFISVVDGTTLQEGDPPSIQAEVVMVKSIN